MARDRSTEIIERRRRLVGQWTIQGLPSTEIVKRLAAMAKEDPEANGKLKTGLRQVKHDIAVLRDRNRLAVDVLEPEEFAAQLLASYREQVACVWQLIRTGGAKKAEEGADPRIQLGALRELRELQESAVRMMQRLGVLPEESSGAGFVQRLLQLAREEEALRKILNADDAEVLDVLAEVEREVSEQRRLRLVSGE